MKFFIRIVLPCLVLTAMVFKYNHWTVGVVVLALFVVMVVN